MAIGKVLEVGYADSNPTDDRLERFQRLAKLQLNKAAAFKRWSENRGLGDQQIEVAKEAWNAAWESMRVGEMFDCLRRAAVFDESFRLPQLKAGTEEFRGNVEEKFGKLMLAISLLTLEIQRGYEGNAEKEKVCLQ